MLNILNHDSIDVSLFVSEQSDYSNDEWVYRIIELYDTHVSKILEKDGVNVGVDDGVKSGTSECN